jgi:hypothetical protein
VDALAGNISGEFLTAFVESFHAWDDDLYLGFVAVKQTIVDLLGKLPNDRDL